MDWVWTLFVEDQTLLELLKSSAFTTGAHKYTFHISQDSTNDQVVKLGTYTYLSMEPILGTKRRKGCFENMEKTKNKNYWW